MSNTFTAQELADFYQKVAAGDEMEFRSTAKGWTSSWGSPCLDSVRQDWRIKPAKKVIDLSVLIESGIDCEFKNHISERTTIGKLLGITNDDWDMYFYTTGNSPDKYYVQCQPRMKHIHAWQGGECPLPEGFKAKVWWRSGVHTIVTIHSRLCWMANSETIAFEVIGIADGYVMPWEQDND
jgi:hypothetical protein